MTPLLYYSLLSITFIITIKIIIQIQSRKLKNLPPGPPTIPIIGNLHQLKHPMHHTFTTLSQKYGDVLSLWFGSRLVVVVSSPSLVQECFNKNDIVLANRPQLLAGKYIFYNYTTLGSSSYGDHWRNLRRITAIDVLSNNRLNSFLGVRTDETNRLIQKLLNDTVSDQGFTKVELRHRLTEMTFNGMMMMISGKRYYGDDRDVTDVEEAKQFRDIISEIMSLLGANKSEFLPFLRLFDLDDLTKRYKKIAKRADAFLQGLIEEHQSGNQSNGDTMIDHLLNLRKSQPEYYSDHMIKGLIQAMLLAGTDTSAVTIEWVMSELLNHPDVLNKAKEEIETQIGKDKLIEEHDLSKLPYLQNIINETLRLHPPAPLSLPHYSSEDFTLGGFNVPKDTIILTNVWAIHRDPKYWSDASSFKPERFEIDGELNKLIAFGLGRRACPGQSLAHRTVGLTLGLLIQCFEWKRETEEKIDLREGKGLTMPMGVPLKAMCKPLPIANYIIS
ncbi:isoflavone 3'-hydroxylase-like [Cicer arietinum]|uniref:Isoflavone 3'-hydroxylase-like n=1 Tax=Cicer arietinum TaxID=3827 RepID=A0A3Q7K739_CICAR|nr:isoflavone 3'-hydroxylase-like [Cicer arietinum]